MTKTKQGFWVSRSSVKEAAGPAAKISSRGRGLPVERAARNVAEFFSGTGRAIDQLHRLKEYVTAFLGDMQSTAERVMAGTGER
ncbi:MAG: hypothetical protein H5T86_12375 [Armatimonadetes bacterium]|nr:hypothetical protein [Armatimonadota bacterium]